jgi:hypothetical protein
LRGAVPHLVIGQITFAPRVVRIKTKCMPAWVLVLWLQSAVLAEPAALALAPSPYEAPAPRATERHDMRMRLALRRYVPRRGVGRMLALAPDPYGPRERPLSRVGSRVRTAALAPSPYSPALQALAPSPYGAVPASLLAPMPY